MRTILNYYRREKGGWQASASARLVGEIWNANKTAELIAADKLGQAISLNVDYRPYEWLVRVGKLLPALHLAALGVTVALLVRKLRKRSRNE